MAISFKVRDGANTQRTVAAWAVWDGDAAEQDVAAAYDRITGNASELFFNPSGSDTLSLVITPDSVSGSSSGSGTATTDNATGTPSGGTAPYTHLWTLDVYTGATPPTADTDTHAATAFTLTGMDPSGIYGAQFTDTVTDALGNTASATVQVFFADNG